MRAALFSRWRSTRGPLGQSSQLDTDAVPHTTMRAPRLIRRITASLIDPAVLS